MYYSGTPTQAVEDEIAIDLVQYKDKMPNYFGLLDTYEELGSLAYTQDGEVPYLLGMYRNVDAKVNGSDYAYQLPTALALSVDDSAAFNSVYTDIVTYAQECYLKFITGEMNLDSDFDAYVASVQAMGIDTCIDLLQKQYESMS